MNPFDAVYAVAGFAAFLALLAAYLLALRRFARRLEERLRYLRSLGERR